jgi:hypothetical protein
MLPAGDYEVGFQGPYVPETKVPVHISGGEPVQISPRLQFFGRLVADTEGLSDAPDIAYRLEGERADSSRKLLGPTLVPAGRYLVEIVLPDGTDSFSQSLDVTAGADSHIQIPASR